MEDFLSCLATESSLPPSPQNQPGGSTYQNHLMVKSLRLGNTNSLDTILMRLWTPSILFFPILSSIWYESQDFQEGIKQKAEGFSKTALLRKQAFCYKLA